MMKIILLPVLLSMLSVSFWGCHKESDDKREPEQVELTLKQKSLVSSNNAFGFDMFRTINKNEDNTKNIFISPLSISLALAMTYNGADGDTKTEMQNTLRFPEMSGDEINEYFKTLSHALLSLDPRVTLGIANSIWYRQGFSVLPGFLEVNQTYYDSEVRALDFNDPASLNTINGWAADKTNDKIPHVISELSNDLVMLLINAIYFKGQWTYEFAKEATADGTFHQVTSGASSVPFMNQEGTFEYYGNDSLQMVELPYGRGNFSMIVLLPKAGYSDASFASGLTPEIWDNYTSQLTEADVAVSLPKFKFEYDRKLNDDLKELGMVKAFGPADFSRINPDADLYIDFVTHNSFVEVNEEGTEAAAVTVVGIVETSADPGPVTFVADHPFIFAIREITTNTIIFIGKVASL